MESKMADGSLSPLMVEANSGVRQGRAETLGLKYILFMGLK